MGPDDVALNRIYEKNKKYMPNKLKEAMDAISKEEMQKRIQVNYDENDDPIFYYLKEGKRIQGTGRHPREEAALWYEKQKKEKNGSNAILVFGSGFGYSLFEVMGKKKEDSLVLVFEEDIYIFKMILCHFDITSLAETQKVLFFIGQVDSIREGFSNLLKTTFVLQSTDPEIFFSYEAVRNKKKEYEKIYEYVLKEITIQVNYFGNDHVDNILGMKNIIQNAKAILQNPSIDIIKDKYKDVPAFIISNGPSLDKNIEQLKKIKHRGLIFATESAIRPLQKHGILPDAMVVVERIKETYEFHFKGIEYPKELVLFALAVVDPRVFSTFSGPIVPIFRYGEPVYRWINEFIGHNVAIDAGANVSHLAVEIAAYVGANPIIFVGQDLAYGTNGITHSKSSIYATPEGSKLDEQVKHYDTKYVEGYDGKRIRTNQLWLNFKQGLETKIEMHPDTVFIDATEGGAKIKGTKRDTLKQAIKQYCTKVVKQRLHELIERNTTEGSVCEQTEKLEQFIRDMEKKEAHSRELASLGREEQVKTKALEKQYYSQKEEKTRREVMNVLEQELTRIEQVVIHSFIGFSLNQVCFSENYFKLQLMKEEKEERELDLIEWQCEFWNYISVLALSMANHLESLISEMKGLVKELRNELQEGEDDGSS